LIFKPWFESGYDEANLCALLHPVLPIIAIKFNHYVLARHDQHKGGFSKFSDVNKGGIWDFSPDGKVEGSRKDYSPMSW
jgi:hypothetical protein